MKHVSLIMLSMFVTVAAHAAKYQLDTGHSAVNFKVAHLKISSVTGNFQKFDGTFDFDEKTGKMDNLVVNIDPNSINTNEADRDKHLRNPDFFDTEKFKTITFKSTKTDVRGNKPVKVTGDLTLHGVTKPVTFNFDFKGIAKDPWGNTNMIFEATTKINRKEFGLEWNKALETGGVLVGEEVTVTVNGEAKPAKTDKAS